MPDSVSPLKALSSQFITYFQYTLKLFFFGFFFFLFALLFNPFLNVIKAYSFHFFHKLVIKL